MFWLTVGVARLSSERVAVAAAIGRVLAADVAGWTTGPLCAIDGAAVRAHETEGASDYAPLPAASVPVRAGDLLPTGMDAVLPGHWFDSGCASVTVAAGSGVTVSAFVALPAGMQVRPLHLSLLAAIGLSDVEVVRRPIVALVVAGAKRGPEAATAMLHALVAAYGGVVGEGAVDLVVHAGRSGPGPDDDGVRVFDNVYSHGVAMRPGESSALGTIGGVPAVLLPGEPSACAVAFTLLVTPLLRRLAGQSEMPAISATLTRKIVSSLGLLEAVPVRLMAGEAIPVADPMMADGVVLVPEGSEGFNVGAIVPIVPLP